jgi:protein-S-isoprenylcysteine O-methyltransferase Ste14
MMNDNVHEAKDTPGVVAHPPLIYAVPLITGLLIDALFPVPFLPGLLTWVPGPPLIGGGLIIGLLGDRALAAAGTNRSPYAPTTELVTRGPYRFTRNPLYLCVTLIYAGIAILANALWAALLLPFVLVVMRWGIIECEERSLERKFGEEYLRYKVRTQRWI